VIALVRPIMVSVYMHNLAFGGESASESMSIARRVAVSECIFVPNDALNIKPMGTTLYSSPCRSQVERVAIKQTNNGRKICTGTNYRSSVGNLAINFWPITPWIWPKDGHGVLRHLVSRCLSKVFDPNNKDNLLTVRRNFDFGRLYVEVSSKLLLSDFSGNSIAVHCSGVGPGRQLQRPTGLTKGYKDQRYSANANKETGNGCPSIPPLRTGIVPAIAGGMWRIPASLLGGSLIMSTCATWSGTRRRLRWGTVGVSFLLGLALSGLLMYALLS
jgi:hypothetical protein